MTPLTSSRRQSFCDESLRRTNTWTETRHCRVFELYLRSQRGCYKRTQWLMLALRDQLGLGREVSDGTKLSVPSRVATHPASFFSSTVDVYMLLQPGHRTPPQALSWRWAGQMSSPSSLGVAESLGDAQVELLKRLGVNDTARIERNRFLIQTRDSNT